MMTRQEAEILIAKYTEGKATPEERRLVEYYFHKHLVNSDDIPDPVYLQKDNKEIWSNLADYIGGHKTGKYKLWPRIAAVSMAWKIAAAVAAITLGVWLYYASSISGLLGGRHPELVSGSPLANDIAPGKNTATLTLANGEVINLSDAKTGVVIDASKLTYSDGTTISSSLRGGTTRQPHTNDEIASIPRNDDRGAKAMSVSTPRGGQYQVVLPDGTKVWLNADSKLSFPSQFSGKERKVLLEGEAYFAVVHNAKQPFRVESKGQVVEDLGTEFNISAYTDEKTVKTTLVEGEARVFSLSSRATAKDLKPNQQATLTANSEIQIKQIDPATAIAWKEGKFVFVNEPIEGIMRKVARWYNVEVRYEGDMSQKVFAGTISRYDNIFKLLDMMEATNTVHFKIEGRRVTVMD